jgi:phosphatidylserine/phosphatidylglycerophosphate/cardiolipin synthase-like enzyme
MAFKEVRVFANCDMATIVWQADPIPGCRGFAVARQVSGAPGDAGNDFVRTWVGFAGQQHQPGESEPSTVWPVQRYIWSDYLPSQGQKVRYQVVPMTGSAANLAKAPQSEWSPWTDWTTVATGQSDGFEAYFNRGIVPGQFLARQANNSAEFKQMLSADVKNPQSKNRVFLSGPLRKALLDLLNKAKQDGVTVYAALYELNDPELMSALEALGAKSNLVLGSGAYSPAKHGKPAIADENTAARQELKQHSSVHVFDRLVKSPHFAHNKFVVFCDRSGNPASVWTGSTNWTVNGLCTQVNNGLLIESPALAKAYKARWDELRTAGSGYPPELAKDGSTPAADRLNGASVTAWNAPCLKFVDLNDASKYIAAAQQGVLFLQFNPGSGDGKTKAFALLQDIQKLDPNKVFIHGVVNQEQKGGDQATIQLTHKGKQLPPVSLDEITPHALTDATKNWFHQEFSYNMVMIHSKVVVVDPFGSKPVVMTGSHNMGPKASSSNDDNFVIIENAPGLAAEYAVNIMGVYGHYKWLYNAYLQGKAGASDAKKKQAASVSPQYDGNLDNDTWQQRYTSGANLREILFWLGKAAPASAVSGDGRARPATVSRVGGPAQKPLRPTKAKPVRKAARPKLRKAKRVSAKRTRKVAPTSKKRKATSTRARKTARSRKKVSRVKTTRRRASTRRRAA